MPPEYDDRSMSQNSMSKTRRIISQRQFQM
jgi:hypothetical protein